MPEGALDRIRSVAQSLEYKEVTSARFKGRSGVKHKFSAVFRGKGRYLAVDVYDEVMETDILRGRIKEQDAEIPYFIKTADAPPKKALKLAKYFGITVTTSSDPDRLRHLMQKADRTTPPVRHQR